MTKLISLLLLSLLLLNCKNKNMEGLYMPTFIYSSDTSVCTQNNLILINNNQAFLKPLANDLYPNISRDTSINLLAEIDFSKKSNTLSCIYDNKKHVWQKIPERFKNNGMKASKPEGYYTFSGVNFNDTLCFIDSNTVIYTTSQNKKNPVYKYNYNRVNDYQFININDHTHSTLCFKSIERRFELFNPFLPSKKFILTPLDLVVKNELLSRKWTPKKTFNLEFFIDIIHLNFKQNQLTLEIRNIDGSHTSKQVAFKRTPDGKIIYFKKLLGTPNVTWRIEKLSSNELTLSFFDNKDYTYKRFELIKGS